jgi:hypothetical protein
MSDSSQPTNEAMSTTSTLEGDSSLPLGDPISTSSSSCSSFSNNISPSTAHSPIQQKQKEEEQQQQHQQHQEVKHQEQVKTCNDDKDEKINSNATPDKLHIAQQMSIINSILNTNTSNKVNGEADEGEASKEQKVRSIDGYEKRFQDTLKLLNAPKWLAAARRKSPLEFTQHKRQQCAANSSSRHFFGTSSFTVNAAVSSATMPNIISTTKQKYDRIRQKYRQQQPHQQQQQQQQQQQYLNVNGSLVAAGVTSSLSSVDSGRYSRSKSSDSHGLTILVDNNTDMSSASNANGPLSAGSYVFYSSHNNILYDADNEAILNGANYDRSAASIARRSFNKLNATTNYQQQQQQQQQLNHQLILKHPQQQEYQRYLMPNSASAASFVAATSCSSSSLLRATNPTVSSVIAQPSTVSLLLPLSGSKSHSALNSGTASVGGEFASEIYHQCNENNQKQQQQRNLFIPHRSHMSLHTMYPSGSTLTSSLSCSTMNKWYKPKPLKLPCLEANFNSINTDADEDYKQKKKEEEASYTADNTGLINTTNTTTINTTTKWHGN